MWTKTPNCAFEMEDRGLVSKSRKLIRMSEETSPCQKRNEEFPKHKKKFFELTKAFAHKYICI
jgi:hypothetical protein